MFLLVGFVFFRTATFRPILIRSFFFFSGYNCVLQVYHSKHIVLPVNLTSGFTFLAQFSYPQCVEQCIGLTTTSSSNEWRCWAITVNTNTMDLPPKCYYHIGPMDTILDEAYLKDDNFHDVYIRQCYRGMKAEIYEYRQSHLLVKCYRYSLCNI